MTDAKELDRSKDACHTPDPSGFGRRSGSRMRGRRPLPAGLAVSQLLLIVGLAAYATPTAHAVDAARSVVAPCALLSTAQRQQVGVNPGVEQPVGDGRGGCVWKSFASAPWNGEYLARLIQGPVPAGTPAAAIDNLPTAEYKPANLDPHAYCVYLIGVAPGETLWAQYSGPNQPGITHQVACANDQAAAAFMVSTFSAVTH
ncbi:MAG TPA: hypothetical protein VK735_26180 [Pseudonocardia sp.]|uniref:hypothetical protein n=1 Tax=Pseudonocardia sp. TaxID=60912 RepID=UPI002C457A7C|nr:hypothetical protein [Pseudonocardia sp.]HTF50947.1 hypothetical protein [Pseudonocardia sp.]